MGMSYKFRMSELIPNAWFYKLRDMAKSRKQSINGTTSHLQKKKQHAVQPSCSPKTARCSKPSTPRKSYHFVRELEGKRGNSGSPAKPRFPVEPSRKSVKKKGFRRETVGYSGGRMSPKQVGSGGCNCRSRVWSAVRSESPPSPAEYSSSEESSEVDPFSPDLRSSPCSCGSYTINVKNDAVISPELELRPIITKSPTKKKPANEPENPKSRSKINPKSTNLPEKPKPRSRTETKSTNSPEIAKPRSRTEPKSTNSPEKRTAASSGVVSSRTTKNKPSSPGGVRLKLSSPRVISGGRRSTSRRSVSWRRSLSESFAVVKSSADPSRDFKDSMVEMIVENKIRDSKEFEDLLACYLSLNAAEYHETIINVFRQLWVDFRRVNRTGPSQRL